MKFKLSKIVTVLPLLLAALPASGNELKQETYQLSNYSDDGSDYMPFRSTQNITGKFDTFEPHNLIKANGSQNYFIILDDAPLATYDGAVQGLSATSVFASKGSNTTPKGKLSTKSLASKRYRQHLAAKQSESQFHVSLRLKRELNVRHSFDTVLNGYTAELTPSEAILISQLEGVKAVDPVGVAKIATDSGPAYIGAKTAWQGTASFAGSKGEGMIIGVIDSGIASYHERVKDIHDVENLPTFNPSFADIGVDGYNHVNPNGVGVYFGDCTDQFNSNGKVSRPAEPNWCNDKLIGVVAFGYLQSNIVRAPSLENPEELETDPDSRSGTGQDTNGHGSHTASTAAGNVVHNIQTEGEIGAALSTIYPHDYVYEQISGVAPHANIISYQTCDREGFCNPEFAIKALEHAIQDHVGVDVINYSVGSNARSPWYDWASLAFLNAREAGIWVATSAGNEGTAGPGTLRTPGNAPWVTSVAAITHDRGFSPKEVTLSGGSASFELETNVFIGEGATQGVPATDLVYAGDVEYNTAADDFEKAGVCGLGSLIPEKVVSKVVVCKRGGANFDGPLSRASKSYAVYKAGAAGMILINTKYTPDNTAPDFHSVPSAHLSEKDGKEILAWLAEGNGHQVSLSDAKLVSSTTYEDHKDLSGRMAAFSSQGPDIFNQDYLAPQISAPGIGILASGLGEWMQEFGVSESMFTQQNYKYTSGTSMAAPHVAGMYLIMKSAHPEWSASEAQSALMLTASTKAKIFGPRDRDGNDTFEPAPLHSSGAGIGRVDLAIETGLVMHESKAGYLQADPFGDIPQIRMPAAAGEPALGPEYNIRDLVKDLPEGWHGDTSKMNLASMAKSNCVEQCRWTRTLKATKDASWNVSYSYTSEGMELSSNYDLKTIDLSAGDTFELTVVAQVNENLNSKWTDGRVVFTPVNDATIPEVSIPVTVEFVAGSAPEEVVIDAHRNVGSVMVDDIVSIGTEEFHAESSSLAKGIKYTALIKRDTDPSDISTNVGISSFVLPVNIPAGSARLVVEVLSTTSPDLDIFLGSDDDLDGVADRYEFYYIPFYSVNSVGYEKLDYNHPTNGDYWLLIHNYGNQFNDPESKYYVESEGEIYDEVTFLVSVVKEPFEEPDTKDMKVTVQQKNTPNSTVPFKLSWNKDMLEGEKYYGSVVLGTSEELPSNIGTMNVEIARKVDDVNLTLLSNDKSVDLAAYNLRFMGNNSAAEQHYQMSLTLVDGAVLESITIASDLNNNADGTSGQTFEYILDDGVLTWDYVQPANATAQTITVVFNYADVAGHTDITPYVTSVLNDNDDIQIAHTQYPEYVIGRPIFAVEASNLLASEHEFVTLTAILIDASINNPELSYTWNQVAGPTISLVNNGDSISFTTPETSKDISLSFELVASNGEQNSNAITTTVFVDVEDKPSGGSTHFFLLLITLTTLFGRRVVSSK